MRRTQPLPPPDQYDRALAVQPLYRAGSELDPRVGEVIASDVLWVPAVIELREEELHWAWVDSRDGHPQAWPTQSEARQRDLMAARGLPRVVRPSAKILGQFVELEDDSDGQSILLFARRWGMLNLCRHGYPASHNPGIMEFTINDVPACIWRLAEGAEWDGVHGAEPLHVWRQWARRASCLMRIAANLHLDRPGTMSDWEGLVSETHPQLLPHKLPNSGETIQMVGKSAERDWVYLNRLINKWLALGQHAPVLTHRNQGLAIKFGAGRRHGMLFGVIGLQMALRVSKFGSVAVCSSCGSIFDPGTRRRGPSAHHRNFCDEEDCKREAVRLAGWNRNGLVRKARELRHQGKSVATIARELGRKPQVVRNWIGGKKAKS